MRMTLTRDRDALAQSRYNSWRRHVKRVFDIGIVLLSLPIVIPLLLVLAVVVMIASPGVPFFCQRRVGRGGKQFWCIKLRTMRPGAEDELQRDVRLNEHYRSNDFKIPADHDPRIYPLGRLLRRISLDELPQLVNVLAGHMSLVGPRPVVPDELEEYGPWKDSYLATRPGLTGRWQVNGERDVRYPERAELDARYVAEWTFATDVKILVKTIPAAFRRPRGY